MCRRCLALCVRQLSELLLTACVQLVQKLWERWQASSWTTPFSPHRNFTSKPSCPTVSWYLIRNQIRIPNWYCIKAFCASDKARPANDAGGKRRILCTVLGRSTEYLSALSTITSWCGVCSEMLMCSDTLDSKLGNTPLRAKKIKPSAGGRD